jgi:integrase
VRTHLQPALGHHRLDRLQPEHVEAFYAECEAAGMAAASVLQIHRILSRALKVAMQRGKVARNVCTLVDAPSLKRVEVQPLSATEARQLLDAAQGSRNAARWTVALALGLRQGEALGLKWPDIDWSRAPWWSVALCSGSGGAGWSLLSPRAPPGAGRCSCP